MVLRMLSDRAPLIGDCHGFFGKPRYFPKGTARSKSSQNHFPVA